VISRIVRAKGQFRSFVQGANSNANGISL
jgi:hypothetical protein